MIRETTALATELRFYYDRDMEGVAVSSETVVSNHSQAVSIWFRVQTVRINSPTGSISFST